VFEFAVTLTMVTVDLAIANAQFVCSFCDRVARRAPSRTHPKTAADPSRASKQPHAVRELALCAKRNSAEFELHMPA
jgi:hypothetical protein